jgi:hypothetical protein
MGQAQSQSIGGDCSDCYESGGRERGINKFNFYSFILFSFNF